MKIFVPTSTSTGQIESDSPAGQARIINMHVNEPGGQDQDPDSDSEN